MSVTQTVLTFVAIPAAIVLVVAALAYAAGTKRTSKRYRPGRPFEFAPVWFLSAPELSSAGPVSVEPISAGPVSAGATAGRTGEEPADALRGSLGGASDRW